MQLNTSLGFSQVNCALWKKETKKQTKNVILNFDWQEKELQLLNLFIGKRKTTVSVPLSNERNVEKKYIPAV